MMDLLQIAVSLVIFIGGIGFLVIFISLPIEYMGWFFLIALNIALFRGRRIRIRAAERELEAARQGNYAATFVTRNERVLAAQQRAEAAEPENERLRGERDHHQRVAFELSNQITSLATELAALKGKAGYVADAIIDRVFRTSIVVSLDDAPDGPRHCARCPALGLYAYGDSEEHARERLKEAAGLLRDTYITLYDQSDALSAPPEEKHD